MNPARKRTVLMAPIIPDKTDYANEIGLRGKDQGNGGFPGPIQVSAKFARRYFPTLMRHLDNFSKSNGGKSWETLQNEFKNLVIGRNSNFNTDELSDEELEKLGGLELVFAIFDKLKRRHRRRIIGTEHFAFSATWWPS